MQISNINTAHKRKTPQTPQWHKEQQCQITLCFLHAHTASAAQSDQRLELTFLYSNTQSLTMQPYTHTKKKKNH